MKLVHEAVIEGREILQRVRTSFLQTFEEEDLRARIELLQELAQLSHRVTAGWNAENIVYEAFDKLLRDVFTIQVAVWEFAGIEKLIKGDGLCSKGNRLLLM